MESRVHETGSVGQRRTDCAEREIIGLDEVSKVIGQLRDWVDPFVLASWVEREAESLRYYSGTDEEFDEKVECNPSIILSVLAYSYAIGIFSSEEIVRNCRTNEAFGALSGGKYLFRQELKWFRSRNRALLTELVGRIFVRAICEWYGLGRTEIAPYLDTYLRHAAIERLDIARHLDAADEC